MSADEHVLDVVPCPAPPTGMAIKLLASSKDINMTTSSPQIESTNRRSLIRRFKKGSVFSIIRDCCENAPVFRQLGLEINYVQRKLYLNASALNPQSLYDGRLADDFRSSLTSNRSHSAQPCVLPKGVQRRYAKGSNLSGQ